MKRPTSEKSFDVMRWLRATRARIYEETKDISFDEKRRWTEEKILHGPYCIQAPVHPQKGH